MEQKIANMGNDIVVENIKNIKCILSLFPSLPLSIVSYIILFSNKHRRRVLAKEKKYSNKKYWKY